MNSSRQVGQLVPVRETPLDAGRGSIWRGSNSKAFMAKGSTQPGRQADVWASTQSGATNAAVAAQVRCRCYTAQWHRLLQQMGARYGCRDAS